ncbi:MAG: 3'-5' exonuclease [Chlamydiota bacterium]
MLGIFLDSETNGLNIRKHRLIELAYKIVDMESGAILESFATLLSIPYEEWRKSDPSSIAVNGLSWDDLKDGMEPDQAAEAIQSSFKRLAIERGKAVFICQNPSFDRPFFSQLIDTDVQEELNWPYHWLDLASMHWSKCLTDEKVFPWDTGVSKNQIAAALGLPPEIDPHQAMNGVDHLILCYEAIIGFPTKAIK